MRARNAILVSVLACAALVAVPAAPVPPAGAANSWGGFATGGFSSPNGDGFWVTYANGGVTPYNKAKSFGDASALPLNAPMLSGASNPAGTGYWLVATDGGIFTYGSAQFYGSTGNKRLAAPIFAMTSTKSGRGYWLVARDGGVFTFGDARFFGSAGRIPLAQPITGITTSPTGNGYRMVAKDGGIFSFGDVPYFGSLPGRGIHVNDVVAMAPTPTNRGYWIVRRTGHVYRFGDAQWLGRYQATTCDPVVGIFSNPKQQGFRIVAQSGATIPFGDAPGGTKATGTPRACVEQKACRPALNTAADYQAVFNTRGPIWSGADGATAVGLGDGRRLWLFGDTFSGPVNATDILPGADFLRNGIGVEKGNCITYKIGGGSVFAKADWIPRTGSDQWIWPMDGVVDRENNVVYVSAMNVKWQDGVSQGFRWRVLDHKIVTLDLQSFAWRATEPMPRGNGFDWGSSMVHQGDWVYVYAVRDGPKQYVARTRIEHLRDGAWEYWNGAMFTQIASEAVPMSFFTFTGTPETGPHPGVTVERYGSGYLASAKRCDLLCSDLSAWYAPTPQGPWYAVNNNAGRIATTTHPADRIAYGGHLVPHSGLWLAVWSQNRVHQTSEKYAYGPKVAAPANLPTADALALRFTNFFPGPPGALTTEPPPPAQTLPPTPTYNVPDHVDLPTPRGFVRR
jgi:hypothetical protein